MAHMDHIVSARTLSMATESKQYGWRLPYVVASAVKRAQKCATAELAKSP